MCLQLLAQNLEDDCFSPFAPKLVLFLQFLISVNGIVIHAVSPTGSFLLLHPFPTAISQASLTSSRWLQRWASRSPANSLTAATEITVKASSTTPTPPLELHRHFLPLLGEQTTLLTWPWDLGQSAVQLLLAFPPAPLGLNNCSFFRLGEEEGKPLLNDCPRPSLSQVFWWCF